MNKRIKKKQIKMNNKKLCKRYPFLTPRNRWTDKIAWDKSDKYSMPYAYTELDCMPEGWRKAFGIQMMEELRKDLIKHNYLNNFRIVEIKEKYGGLRFYTGSVPKDSNVFEIISKYENLSLHKCMICGRDAETTCDGYWLETICDKCKEKINRRRYNGKS